MAEVSDDTTREVSSSPRETPVLAVLSGVLPGDSTRVRLGSSRVLLGRDSSCDVHLDFSEVSRRHAELRFDGSALVIHDLGSTNGTYVDGRRVQTTAIRLGSLIRVGAWLGIVEGLSEGELSLQRGALSPGLIGGVLLNRALGALKAVAPSALPVVLVGATGTGKERFASALHRFSGRGGPFHAVNCAALPSALAESELFGHEKGAFTGAEAKTRGHFRAADNGTLLLDEVQELPLNLQAKILRAVELKEVTPLGESRTFSFDARIVVATQRPLLELVAAGRFRDDLAMRLSGLTVSIPALAQRRADIPTLFHHFLIEHSSGQCPSVSTKVYERLCLHDWPGNVRELELMARRMLTLHSAHTFTVDDLPPGFGALPEIEREASLTFVSRDDEDRHNLDIAMRETGGNVKRAAELARLSRARAYRLLGKRTTDNEEHS